MYNSSTIFIFASLLNKKSILKEMNLSHEANSSFKTWPHSERGFFVYGSKEEVTEAELFHDVKAVETQGG